MPVNLPIPHAEELHPVAGFRLGVTEAGVRKANRKDLTVLLLDEGPVGAVFTQNRFVRHPFRYVVSIWLGGTIRAMVINAGNANAGTGAEGLARARLVCEAMASQLGVATTGASVFHGRDHGAAAPNVVAGLPRWLTQTAATVARCAGHHDHDTQPKAISRQVVLGGRP